MPQFTTDTTLGTTASPFVTTTRIHAGGTADYTNWSSGTAVGQDVIDFGIASDATVTGRDCLLNCRIFGVVGSSAGTTVEGTADFERMVVNMWPHTTNNSSLAGASGRINTAASGMSHTFTDVTLRSDLPTYFVFGGWNGGAVAAAPIYNWTRVTLDGALVPSTNSTLSVPMNFFDGSGGIRTFEGVNFWNGVTIQDAVAAGDTTFSTIRGGVLQAATTATIVSPTFGPFGIQFNANTAARHSRVAFRFSGGANLPGTSTTAVVGNHCGFVLNPDFRALSQINETDVLDGGSFLSTTVAQTATNIRWDLVFDAGGNSWVINPLMGRPNTDIGRLDLVPFFDSEMSVRFLMGTNPLANGDDHWYTFTGADRDDGIFQLPSTFTSSGVTSITLDSQAQGIPTVDGSTTAANTSHVNALVINNPANGFLFTHQYANSSVSVDYPASGNTARVTFTAMTDRTYRKYSWDQQANTYNETTNPFGFGKPITLSPPAEGVDDDAVLLARQGGYTELDADGWIGGVVVNDPDDAAVVETTLSYATALINYGISGNAITAGQSFTGSDIVGMMKAFTIDAEVEGITDTDNTLVSLPYSIADGVVDLGSDDMTISATATAVAYSGTAWTIPVNLMTASNNVTTITTTGVITRPDVAHTVEFLDANSPQPGDIIIEHSGNVRVDVYNSTSDAVISANVANGTVVDVSAATGGITVVATGSGFTDEIVSYTDFTEILMFTASEVADPLYASGATALGGTSIVTTITTGTISAAYSGFASNSITATDWNRTINDTLKGTVNYNQILNNAGADASLVNLAGGSIQFDNTVWTMTPGSGQGTQFAYWTPQGSGTSFGEVTGTGTFSISAPASTDAVQAANQVAGQVDARVAVGVLRGLEDYDVSTQADVDGITDSIQPVVRNTIRANI